MIGVQGPVFILKIKNTAFPTEQNSSSNCCVLSQSYKEYHKLTAQTHPVSFSRHSFNQPCVVRAFYKIYFLGMPSQPLVPNDPPPRTSRGSKGSGNFGGIDRKLSRETRSPKDSRTLSQRFIRAPQFDTSHFVWIENDKKIWTLCTILRQDNTVLKLQDLDSSNMYKIDIGFDEVMVLL